MHYPPLAQPEIVKPARRFTGGFSLIQVSLILTAGALVMVSLLPGQDAGDYNRKVINNVRELEAVEEAMKGFMAAHGRRPCPADGDYDVDTANFGREAANPGDCTGGTPAVSLGPDAGTGNVVAGVIPTKTLGLPDEYALDEFGRRFTYMVDRRATNKAACLALESGTPGVEIQDGAGAVKDQVTAAYLSHGPDGHGAFPAQGSTAAGRFNSASTDAHTLDNASVDASFAVSFDNVFVWKERTGSFDDLVYYAIPLKSQCCIGQAACQQVGFRIDGTESSELSGWALASGDINGDGFKDLIIGAYSSDGGGQVNSGRVYVVFGNSSGSFPNPLLLNTLDGSTGFVLEGSTAFYKVGQSVAAGDINGDGYDDVIAGTYDASYNGLSGSGSTYVVFGKASGWAASYSLASGGALIDGTNGFRLDGPAANDSAGNAVTTGDINGDGKKEIIIGGLYSRAGNPCCATTAWGSVFVVFGKAGAWASTNLMDAAFLNGTNGFRLNGNASMQYVGSSIASGDFDGDGKDDLIVGAYGISSGAGAAYLVKGKAAGWAATTAIGTLMDGTNGMRLDGAAAGDFMGIGAAVGDINGDGKADAMISSYGSDIGNVGSVYVVFGAAIATPSATITSLMDGTNGFRLTGAFPSRLAGADITGDGKADVIIGSQGASGNAGATYAIFGKAAGWAGSATVASFMDGTNGAQFNGVTAGDNSGAGLTAGDINGDGRADICIGAYGSDVVTTNAGSTYVYFGKTSGWAASFNLGDL
jgi:hypothetical protein